MSSRNFAKSSHAIVTALFDFEHNDEDGRVVRMRKGEKLLIIRKTNSDWWQVQRIAKSVKTNDSEDDDDNQSEEFDDNDDLIPFYAPVSYLREVVESKAVSSANGKHVHYKKASFKRNFARTLNVEDDRLNETASSRESIVEDDFEISDNITNCDSSTPRNKSQSKSPSPVYANLPLLSSRLPPVPNPGVTPNRILLNHWAEYVDSSGRKYYYNSLSRETSWKPPRRRIFVNNDESATSHSEENLTDSSTTSTPISRSLSKSPSLTPSPTPKPKTRIRKQRHKFSAGTAPPTVTTFPPALPKGWTRKLNAETRELYFMNDKTKGKVRTYLL